MAYRRPIRASDGEVLCACSVCGFPYLYPSELIRADDRNFYCLRTCAKSETVEGHNKRRATWRPPQENDNPLPGAIKPSWRP